MSMLAISGTASNAVDEFKPWDGAAECSKFCARLSGVGANGPVSAAHLPQDSKFGDSTAVQNAPVDMLSWTLLTRVPPV